MTQRLSNAKEAASKPVAVQSHEDLAKKLQVSCAILLLSLIFSMILKTVFVNLDDYVCNFES